MLQLVLSNLLFEARNGTEIGRDVLVSRILKSPDILSRHLSGNPVVLDL